MEEKAHPRRVGRWPSRCDLALPLAPVVLELVHSRVSDRLSRFEPASRIANGRSDRGTDRSRRERGLKTRHEEWDGGVDGLIYETG